MPLTTKDLNFVQFLLNQTREGRIKWESTAEKNQFTTSFKGTYNVTVSEEIEDLWTLRLRDSSDRELLIIWSSEYSVVKELFFWIVRTTLEVDKALDEIMNVEDKDIPF